MKKSIILGTLICAVLCSASAGNIESGVSSDASFSFSGSNSVFVRNTKAWMNMLGTQGTFWKSWNASVYQENGEEWIYVKRINVTAKGKVADNPDYSGPLGMGPRKNHKYRSLADDGVTYYFD